MNEKLTPDSGIFVAGHRGLVGSAIVRRFSVRGFSNIITRTRAELDLSDALAVRKFLGEQQPRAIVLAAAKVGGILANDRYPAEFIHENMAIQNAVIHGAWLAEIRDLLFLGSSCIYPREAPQPIKESYLLTGPLEPTNSAYAVAKIAGIEMCVSYNRQYGTRYRAIMPTNLYGPGDNFNLENSHVIPALIRKFHEAKIDHNAPVALWGTGQPMREFMYVDDMAEAAIHTMQLSQDVYQSLIDEQSPLINIGTGKDLSIRELALMIQSVVGHAGEIVFDASKPDGTPRKLLDITRLAKSGWQASTPLNAGLRMTYDWYLENQGQFRA